MASLRLEDVKILIVDDDEDILGGMELAIRAEGADTITAADGNEAVAAWRRHAPSVVILDMMLPKMSGFLVLEELMASTDSPIVIMVTANEGKRHMAYAENLGVHAYLTKPIPLQQLIDTICDLYSQPSSDADGTMTDSN
ncbi:MAG: response regulator [Phycisphaerales bacterium]|nr:response regulator [Phycisphaerales bacterium]